MTNRIFDSVTYCKIIFYIIFKKKLRSHSKKFTDTEELCNRGIQERGEKRAHCVQCNQCNHRNYRDYKRGKRGSSEPEPADDLSVRAENKKNLIREPWSPQTY